MPHTVAWPATLKRPLQPHLAHIRLEPSQPYVRFISHTPLGLLQSSSRPILQAPE